MYTHTYTYTNTLYKLYKGNIQKPYGKDGKVNFQKSQPVPMFFKTCQVATKFIHKALLTCHTSAQVDARQGITEPRKWRGSEIVVRLV